MKPEDDVPCLIVIEPGPGGSLQGTRLPVGVPIVIHESNTKTTAPMAVTKITLQHIDLECVCGNPQCDLRLRLQVKKSGRHPLRLSQE